MGYWLSARKSVSTGLVLLLKAESFFATRYASCRGHRLKAPLQIVV